MEVNGTRVLPHGEDGRSQIEFYEKLFRLQEDVLAGTHPRIRLPVAALEQLASSGLSQASSSTSKPAVNGTSNGNVRTPIPTATHDAVTKPAPSSTLDTPPPSALRHRLPLKPTSSGINPVLLTKSDDLVRAEMQLKRQRIEREMKDQCDARKVQPRDKDFGLDAESRFDVSEMLAKALTLVQPISGLTTSANQNSSTSDTVDENSYYSSQANSSSSVGGDNAEPVSLQVPAPDDKGKAPVIELDSPSDPSCIPVQDVDANDADYEPAADIEMVDTTPYHAVSDIEQEDSDYSPPPADLSAGPSHVAPRGREAHQSTSTQIHVVDHSPPEQDVPLIHNDIRSPIAPQPSRISALATARRPKAGDRVHNNNQVQQSNKKGSSSKQNGRPLEEAAMSGSRRTSPRTTGQQSPNGPRQKVQNPKKRRREGDGSEKRRNSGKRVARSPIRSPEPYIKPEPVSPPSLPVMQSQPRVRRPMHALVDEDEIVSPREGRSRPVYYREVEARVAPRMYDPEEPAPPTLVRVPSRGAYRVIHRDDQDLRRVASLQYARRPYSPGPQPIIYQDTRGIRSASQAYLDPPNPPTVYRSGSIRPDHFIRTSPPTFPDDGRGGSRAPLAMVPPPAMQMYMDDQGNRYYAAPPQEAPPLIPRLRRVESEVVYERAASRAPPREPAVYEDGDSMRPPPPPPPPRRYVESDIDHLEQAPYRPERAYSMRPGEPLPPREVSYAPAERRPAPAIIYEDMLPPPPREYAARAYSVRPEIIRREVPVEYIARHESVQPGYVRRADPPPMYLAEPQHRRYVEDDGQDVYNGNGEGIRRAGYRY